MLLAIVTKRQKLSRKGEGELLNFTADRRSGPGQSLRQGIRLIMMMPVAKEGQPNVIRIPGGTDSR